MFSLIASVLFRPSAAVGMSVKAVKASVANVGFDPRKVVGMNLCCTRACACACACVCLCVCMCLCMCNVLVHVHVNVWPLVSICHRVFIQLASDFKVSGLQLRRYMRSEGDRVGQGTSDSHGSCFLC